MFAIINIHKKRNRNIAPNTFQTVLLPAKAPTSVPSGPAIAVPAAAPAAVPPAFTAADTA